MIAKSIQALVLVLCVLVTVAHAADPEEVFWQSVLKSHAREEYELYLKQYPKGRYAEEAKKILDASRENARRQRTDVKAKRLRAEEDATRAADVAFWESVKDSRNPGELKAYLEKFPAGVFAGLAQMRINALSAQGAQKAKAKAAVPGSPSPTGLTGQRAPTPWTPAPARLREMKDFSYFRDCADCPEMIVVYGMVQVRKSKDGTEERTSIRDFAAGRFEITVGQFAQFVRETNYRSPVGCNRRVRGKGEFDASLNWSNPGFPQTHDHPAVCIGVKDAEEYAMWLSRKTDRPYRLLDEHEWSALFDFGPSDKRYGDAIKADPCKYGNVMDTRAQPLNVGTDYQACDDGFAATAPVGSFPPNPTGFRDLWGNAWEWISTCSPFNPDTKQVIKPGETCDWRLLRGHSWTAGVDNRNVDVRRLANVSERSVDFGFRVSRSD